MFQEASFSGSTYVYRDLVKRERERFAAAGQPPPVPGASWGFNVNSLTVLAAAPPPAPVGTAGNAAGAVAAAGALAGAAIHQALQGNNNVLAHAHAPGLPNPPVPAQGLPNPPAPAPGLPNQQAQAPVLPNPHPAAEHGLPEPPPAPALPPPNPDAHGLPQPNIDPPQAMVQPQPAVLQPAPQIAPAQPAVLQPAQAPGLPNPPVQAPGLPPNEQLVHEPPPDVPVQNVPVDLPAVDHSPGGMHALNPPAPVGPVPGLPQIDSKPHAQADNSGSPSVVSEPRNNTAQVGKDLIPVDSKRPAAGAYEAKGYVDFDHKPKLQESSHNPDVNNKGQNLIDSKPHAQGDKDGLPQANQPQLQQPPDQLPAEHAQEVMPPSTGLVDSKPDEARNWRVPEPSSADNAQWQRRQAQGLGPSADTMPSIGPSTPGFQKPPGLLDPKTVEAAAKSLARAGLPAVAGNLADVPIPPLLVAGAGSSALAASGSGAAAAAAGAAGGAMALGMLGVAALGAAGLAYLLLTRKQFPNFKLEGAVPFPEKNLIGWCISYMVQIKGFVEVCGEKNAIQPSTCKKIHLQLKDALETLNMAEEKLLDNINGFMRLVDEFMGALDMMVKRMQLYWLSEEEGVGDESTQNKKMERLRLLAYKDQAQSAMIEASLPFGSVTLDLQTTLGDAWELHLGALADAADQDHSMEAPSSPLSPDVPNQLRALMVENLKHARYAKSDDSLGRVLSSDAEKIQSFYTGFSRGSSIMLEDMERTRKLFHKFMEQIHLSAEMQQMIMRNIERAHTENADGQVANMGEDLTSVPGDDEKSIPDVCKAYHHLLEMHKLLGNFV